MWCHVIELQDDSAVYALQNFVNVFESRHQVPRSSVFSSIGKTVDNHYILHPLSCSIVQVTYPYSNPRVACLAESFGNVLDFSPLNEDSFRTAANATSGDESNSEKISNEKPSDSISVNDQSMITEAPTTCSNLPVSFLFYKIFEKKRFLNLSKKYALNSTGNFLNSCTTYLEKN